MSETRQAKSLMDYRLERYMSTKEFAGLIGVTERTLFRIVKGETQPHLTTMRKIAQKLGVHPSEITEFAQQSTGDS